MREHPSKPRRLGQIFQSYDTPIYFVALTTFDRIPTLGNARVHDKLISFAKQAEAKGVAFGRYVIMPDHIHCFIRIAPDKRIGTTIRLLKRSLYSAIEVPPPHWQPGFFDQVLRHAESYYENGTLYTRIRCVRVLLKKRKSGPIRERLFLFGISTVSRFAGKRSLHSSLPFW